MVKTPSTPPHPDNLVLAQLTLMRDQQTAVFEMVKRAVELVGRQTEESAGVRSDLAAIRADLAHIKSDIVHLENQNISRHGESMNILERIMRLEIDRGPPPLPGESGAEAKARATARERFRQAAKAEPDRRK
jgi:hypothetical protein